MRHKTYISLVKVFKALREVYPDMPITMALVFIEVAKSDGMTVSQVEKATGLTQSSASRNCRSLTKWKNPKSEGLDLCEWRQCREDQRSQILVLNARGEELAKKLDEAIL